MADTPRSDRIRALLEDRLRDYAASVDASRNPGSLHIRIWWAGDTLQVSADMKERLERTA
jgi:hypothetical protein